MDPVRLLDVETVIFFSDKNPTENRMLPSLFIAKIFEDSVILPQMPDEVNHHKCQYAKASHFLFGELQ